MASSQSSQTAVLLSSLPPELLSYIFGFLNPADLAGSLSSASKSFLTQTNIEGANPATETDRVISFAPGRNAQLNELLMNHANQPLTELQYILLQPGHQTTPTQRRLFLQARGEILAGRLSLTEAMVQIQELSDLSGGAFLTSKLLLAKQLRAQLEPWQDDALKVGFTFADLCSNWLSSDEDVQRVQTGQQTAEELRALRTLSAYQRTGLEAGFTLEQVRSPWFTPIHAEATQPPYDLALHVLANTTPQQVLRRLLDIGDEREMDDAAWRALMIAPFGEGPGQGLTHFYRAAVSGHVAVLTAMREAGGFNQEQWSTLISTPLAHGPSAGYTPLYSAAALGHAAMLTLVREAGGYNQQQWRTLTNVEGTDEPGWDMITAAEVKEAKGMTNSPAEAPKKEVKPQQHGSGKRETKPAQSSQSSLSNSVAAMFGKKTPAPSGSSTPAVQADAKKEGGNKTPVPKSSSPSGSPEVQKKDNDPPDDNDSLIMMK